MGPTVHSTYPRRLESLTHILTYGSTFSSVILRPWVLVRAEANSQPPACLGGGGGGILPYMGYIGMCRCEGYGFQAVYSRIGYINQSVWV